MAMCCVLSLLSAILAVDGRLILRSDPYETAREVSDLSDQIYIATRRVQSLRSDISEGKRYYEDRKKLLERQIEIRKRQLKANPYPIETDYQQGKENDFRSVMCSEVLRVWMFSDSSARMHLARLCLGRDSLALLQSPGRSSTLLTRSSEEGNHSFWKDKNFSDSLHELQNQTNLLLAWEERLQREGRLKKGPAEEMRSTLQRIKAEEQSLAQQLAANKAAWKRELDTLNEEEDSLGNQYGSQHFDRAAADKAAWAKVKAKFCPGGALADNAMQHCDDA